MTDTNYRALCAELVDNLERYQCWYIEDNGYGLPDLEGLLRRADAALAQPEPEGPTDEELEKLWMELIRSRQLGVNLRFARAVLQRWGHHISEES